VAGVVTPVTELNRELERTHDASLRLASEIQRTSRLDALGGRSGGGAVFRLAFPVASS
jgi:hypothetical protein